MLYMATFPPEPIRWGSPVSHLVSRPPDAEAWGDASLIAGGSFSLDLQFWWHISWPPEVRDRKINHIEYWDYDKEQLVSINVLEFVVIIITYALQWITGQTPIMTSTHTLSS